MSKTNHEEILIANHIKRLETLILHQHAIIGILLGKPNSKEILTIDKQMQQLRNDLKLKLVEVPKE